MRKLLKRLFLAALACLAYGVLIENQRYKVRRVTVPVLPVGAESLRVLHFSDLHLLRRNRSRIAFLSTLAGLEPDLVVSTGDNLAEADAIETLGESLGRLLDVPGVFCFGSADYEVPQFRNPVKYVSEPSNREGLGMLMPTNKLEHLLSSGVWRNVTGKRAVLEVRGLKLEFRGTDDAHLALDDYTLVSGPASKGVDLSIGVTHAPYERVLNEMAEDRVKLIFAGHTHGGQICVPVYGALTTNCDLNTKYAKGLWRLRSGRRNYYLHVSAGLGTSPFAPYRFACPPEVTLLTLVPKK